MKFDQFVEQGRVLHNYASILELLLRLRQCCDHPFLVMRCFLFLRLFCNFFSLGFFHSSTGGGNEMVLRHLETGNLVKSQLFNETKREITEVITEVLRFESPEVQENKNIIPNIFLCPCKTLEFFSNHINKRVQVVRLNFGLLMTFKAQDLTKLHCT